MSKPNIDQAIEDLRKQHATHTAELHGIEGAIKALELVKAGEILPNPPSEDG